MTQKSSIQMSQGYDVLSPKTGKAYPILCEEWAYLKIKVRSISEKPNLYYSIALLLLGSSLSTLITILTGGYSNPNNPTKLIIALATLAVTLLVGIICLYFAKEQRKINRTKASDVLSQMDLIERRYQDESNDSTLEEIILSQPFRLTFNPETKKSKKLAFGPAGLIVEGNNQNEHSWRVIDDKLELMNLQGKVFSRFYYDKKEEMFKHTNEEDTLSIRGQYMVPEA